MAKQRFVQLPHCCLERAHFGPGSGLLFRKRGGAVSRRFGRRAGQKTRRRLDRSSVRPPRRLPPLVAITRMRRAIASAPLGAVSHATVFSKDKTFDQTAPQSSAPGSVGPGRLRPVPTHAPRTVLAQRCRRFHLHPVLHISRCRKPARPFCSVPCHSIDCVVPQVRPLTLPRFAKGAGDP